MTDTPNTSVESTPSRRRIALTVLVLIGLIIVGILIGIFSVLWGGPVQPPPESVAPGLRLVAAFGGLL
jgi:hypothetical protein